MEVFISETFLNKLDAIDSTPRLKVEISETKDQIKRILFSKLKINHNMSLSSDEVGRILSSISIPTESNQEFPLKERFIRKLIRSESEGGVLEIPKNHKAFYFYDSSFEFENKIGLIYMNDEDKFQEFYVNCNVASIPLMTDYSIIEHAVPPCNSMLIIDPYLFGKPFSKKLKNLIKYINIYQKNDLNIPFQLTILAGAKLGDFLIDQTFVDEAIKQLNKINNLEYAIYLNEKPGSDRYFFTNYTYGSIGHPFDDRETNFSQNFMGGCKDVYKMYRYFILGLCKWNKSINSISVKTSFSGFLPNKKNEGLQAKIIQTVYSNKIDFKNRLFDNL
jgi:hypothetical protein